MDQGTGPARGRFAGPAVLLLLTVLGAAGWIVPLVVRDAGEVGESAELTRLSAELEVLVELGRARPGGGEAVAFQGRRVERQLVTALATASPDVEPMLVSALAAARRAAAGAAEAADFDRLSALAAGIGAQPVATPRPTAPLLPAAGAAAVLLLGAASVVLRPRGRRSGRPKPDTASRRPDFVPAPAVPPPGPTPSERGPSTASDAAAAGPPAGSVFPPTGPDPALLPLLARERARAVRHGRDLTVVVIRLDDAETLAARHGGDALEYVRESMQEFVSHHVRASDVILRFDERSACLILPETPATPASGVAGKLVRTIGAFPFADEITATASAVVFDGASAGALDPQTLSGQVEQALAGRSGEVVVAPPSGH